MEFLYNLAVADPTVGSASFHQSLGSSGIQAPQPQFF